MLGCQYFDDLATGDSRSPIKSPPKFKPGDFVMNSERLHWPWAEYFCLAEEELALIDPEIQDLPHGLKLPLAYLGLSGLTSYLGVKSRGKVTSGDVVVVSGAAGSCGTLAGQFALEWGAKKVIGICGSDEKCRALVDRFRFTTAVNYKSPAFESKLAEACADGVDVYFDNVGGEISRIVIVDHMKPAGRVVLCGQIADYNKDVPYPPPIPKDMQDAIVAKSIDRERFLVLSYQDQFPEASGDMKKMILEGKIRVEVTEAEGIEKAGWALVNMMNGGNIGKQVVKVCDSSRRVKQD
ncbi:unnamed protein product [Notodromas monacha]|uniref:15-oxoprostaglandin 13-reductase n=1 Tax=Notodromas monacha TaxID=399045 RepID=A0A7R9BWT8_9CRUS|nr:unnamed protein product [Notodromas monacha]CAG0922266.1 unnamed protein product [Notodromas monacha]